MNCVSFLEVDMPKVTESYKQEKKMAIVACLRELARTKPVYSITMQELINETGMSQGAIYRYYSDIDQVLKDLWCELNQQEIQVKKEIDEVLEEDGSPEQLIYDLFQLLADFYMEDGNIFNETNRVLWELNTLYLYNKPRVRKIVGETDTDNITTYIRNRLKVYLEEYIKKGYFKPVVGMDELVALISSQFDGTVYNFHILTYHKKKEYQGAQKVMVDMHTMMDGLITISIHLLGGDSDRIVKR